eukprot:362905-Chlamydomonas_euryale.AAC.4
MDRLAGFKQTRSFQKRAFASDGRVQVYGHGKTPRTRLLAVSHARHVPACAFNCRIPSRECRPYVRVRAQAQARDATASRESSRPGCALHLPARTLRAAHTGPRLDPAWICARLEDRAAPPLALPLPPAVHQPARRASRGFSAHCGLIGVCQGPFGGSAAVATARRCGGASCCHFKAIPHNPALAALRLRTRPPRARRAFGQRWHCGESAVAVRLPGALCSAEVGGSVHGSGGRKAGRHGGKRENEGTGQGGRDRRDIRG